MTLLRLPLIWLRFATFALVPVLIFPSSLEAHSGINTRIYELPGLPLQLLRLGVLQENPEQLDASQIVRSYLENGGVILSEPGYTVSYQPEKGILLCRLPEKQLDLVTYLIDQLYKLENLLEANRAFLEQVTPLSPKERVEFVLQFGVFGDPLLSEYARRIQALEGRPFTHPRYSPFHPNPPPHSPDPEPRARQEEMRAVLAELIEYSLATTAKELEMVGDSPTEGLPYPKKGEAE